MSDGFPGRPSSRDGLESRPTSPVPVGLSAPLPPATLASAGRTETLAMPLLSRATLIPLLVAAPGAAAEFFAAPGGTPGGDGSKARPWDLVSALAGPAALKPGDTLWLRGG